MNLKTEIETIQNETQTEGEFLILGEHQWAAGQLQTAQQMYIKASKIRNKKRDRRNVCRNKSQFPSLIKIVKSQIQEGQNIHG